MHASTLSERVQPELLSFAWRQWAQMGVLAQAGERDRWAQDPEALLVFGLEVSRLDPRLFDEILGWLVVNAELVSRQRLMNLCPPDDPTRPVVDGALEWARGRGARLRPLGKPARNQAPRLLFHGLAEPLRQDPAFARFGLDKPPASDALRSSPPDRSLPVNLAFVLRDLFGIGTRAEIVRFLLTSRSQGAPALEIARESGYAKRNVAVTLGELSRSGHVESFWRGNEGRYRVDIPRWAGFLGLAEEAIPGHRSWTELLPALRELLFWAFAWGTESDSDYIIASRARSVVERITSPLANAGVRVVDAGTGADYWPSFVATVENALALVSPRQNESPKAP